MPSTLKTRTAPASVPLSPSSYALHHPASQIKENSPHRRSRPRVCASMKNRVRVSGTGFSNEASIRGGVSHPSIPLTHSLTHFCGNRMLVHGAIVAVAPTRPTHSRRVAHALPLACPVRAMLETPETGEFLPTEPSTNAREAPNCSAIVWIRVGMYMIHAAIGRARFSDLHGDYMGAVLQLWVMTRGYDQPGGCGRGR